MRLELVRAVSIVMRTLPYVVFRLAVWAGVWLLALVVLSMLGLISVMFGAAAFWAGLAALVVLCIGLGLGNWAKAYLLDVPRGCHIALLVEHAGEGLQPAGRVQPGWAKTRLLQRFGSLSSYQTCCELIGKAVRDIHQKVLGKNVPIPTRDSDRNPSVPPRFVALTLPRVIETMLAFVFVEDEGNGTGAVLPPRPQTASNRSHLNPVELGRHRCADADFGIHPWVCGARRARILGSGQIHPFPLSDFPRRDRKGRGI